MNITVYCGSMCGKDPAFANAARELGRWIADEGNVLVYGGGGIGLMGVVSDAVLEHGGKVIGVIPSFLVDREASHSGISELITTNTMDERKQKMIDLGDAYVALPGGPGTIEEISEIMSLKKLGIVSGFCALFNVRGYYDALARVYDEQVEQGFATPEERSMLHVVTSVSELAALLR